MNARHAGLLIVAATLLLGGCSDRKLRPLNPCTVTGVVRKVSAGGSENVDLLLMVDNSGSMQSEQAALQAQLPNMAEVLLTGDLDGDNVPDFPAVESLRVGVVTSDMGVLGVGVIPGPIQTGTPPLHSSAINRCGGATNAASEDKAFFGDDGEIKLVSSAFALDPDTALPGCEPTYPTFLQFDGGTDAQRLDFVNDVACTAVLGTDGCGFEMQLESVLVAVTDSGRADAPDFVPTVAQGASRARVGRETTGESNDGFFRAGSVIAIVVVTDEEDCSTDNPQVFMFEPTQSSLQDPAHNTVPTAGDMLGDFRLNTRCTHFDDELYEIQRYVDGLIALSPDDPNKIVFAGIVGLPPALEDGETFDQMLADPAMQYTDRIDGDGDIIDFNADPFIEPACWRCPGQAGVTAYADCDDVDIAGTPDVDETTTSTNESLQWAAPGRRYVELADALTGAGANAVIRSICTDDFGPAMASILSRIGDVLRGACLPRALNPDATGAVNCDVVEILPVGETCADRAAAVGGRDPTPIRTEAAVGGGTREVCRVEQLIASPADRTAGNPPGGVGWFYDDYSNVLADCPPDQQQRIGFTGADPVGDVRLECLQPVTGGGTTSVDLFTPCATSDQCSLAGASSTDIEEIDDFIFRYNLERSRFIDANGVATGTQPMSCEPATRTCQIDCNDASNCPGGFVCINPATLSSVNCATEDCFCTNPTCVVGGGGGGSGSGGGAGGGGGDVGDAG